MERKKKNNTLMNQMIILKDSSSPNRVDIPSHIQVQKEGDEKLRHSKTKQKKMFKFKFQDMKRKSLHQLLFSSIKYVDLKSKQAYRIPKSILNILYCYKIKNYNPYLEALKELSQLKENISFEEENNIKRLCYIGIVRQFLINKKSSYSPPLSKVGILIRNYMLKPMKKMIENRKNNKTTSVFIHINNSCLNFDPKAFPEELSKLISKKKYAEIIREINKIIENEYILYKVTNQLQLTNQLTYSEYFIIVLMIILLFILIFKPDIDIAYEYGLHGLLLFGSCMGIVGTWIQSKNKLESVISSTNVTQKIELKIQKYLSSISDEAKLIWKVGRSFYWLEIQNAQIKVRKYGDRDYF